MNVRIPCISKFQHLPQTNANKKQGWVKEQSLQGIINWFDFWLIRNHQK